MTPSRAKREFQRLIFVVLFLGSSCSALPVILRGRPRGGMLGSPLPPKDVFLSARTLPPNMWMSQRLDHFHASDTRTWNQVSEGPVFRVNKFETATGKKRISGSADVAMGNAVIKL